MYRIRERLFREEWNLGVVAQSAAEIAASGIVEPIRWMPRCGPWRMLADPCCYWRADGSRVILAEHLDYWQGRGEIWAAVVPPGGDLARAAFTPWLRSNVHLSYPGIVEEAGARFLIVESWEADSLHLWREDGAQWTPLGAIIPGPLIDATPWNDGRRWWMFATRRDDHPDSHLYLYSAPTLRGPWRAHAGNPVKVDRSASRPAGPLFWARGQLIRPTQDCTATYGGAITLNAVNRLDDKAFIEVPVRHLSPAIGSAYPHGLHTLCPAGDETIIDGKHWGAHPLDLPRKLMVRRRLRARSGRPDLHTLRVGSPPGGAGEPLPGRHGVR